MVAQDLLHLRTALLITLSILLVLVLARRLKRNAMAKDMPAPSHAEVLELAVAYHPARLLVEVRVPDDQTLSTSLLDADHRAIHTWEAIRFERGKHLLERPLPVLSDGAYFLEMSTTTQRTVRQFRLQQT